MGRVVLVCGTTEVQTSRIAAFLGEVIRASGTKSTSST